MHLPYAKAIKAGLYDARLRAILTQVLLLALVGWTGYSAFHNVLGHLASQGVASGFGFLDDRAGFDIIMHLIPYPEHATFLRAFWVGLLNTLLVSLIGIIIATTLGLFVGIARLSANALLRGIATLYVEIIRNIPLLLQIFFWYFAVLRSLPNPRNSWALEDWVFINIRGIYIPEVQIHLPAGWWGIALGLIALLVLSRISQSYLRRTKSRQLPLFRWAFALILAVLLGLLMMFPENMSLKKPVLEGFNFVNGWVLIPEFTALALALSLYTAAFIAEIVRSGITSVPKGQWEAATALGLSQYQTLKMIILPQALRVIIPPLTNQYLNLTKNSSLAAAIAYPDLVSVFAGTVLTQTGQAVEVIGLTMMVYLVISLSISACMLIYEQAHNKAG